MFQHISAVATSAQERVAKVIPQAQLDALAKKKAFDLSYFLSNVVKNGDNISSEMNICRKQKKPQHRNQHFFPRKTGCLVNLFFIKLSFHVVFFIFC